MSGVEKFGRRASSAIVDLALGKRREWVAAKYSVEFGDVLDLVHALGDPPRVVFPRGAAIEDPPDPPRFVDRSQPRDE